MCNIVYLQHHNVGFGFSGAVSMLGTIVLDVWTIVRRIRAPVMVRLIDVVIERSQYNTTNCPTTLDDDVVMML